MSTTYDTFLATKRLVAPPFPSVLGYFGKRRDVFADVFGDAGKVVLL